MKRFLAWFNNLLEPLFCLAASEEPKKSNSLPENPFEERQQQVRDEIIRLNNFSILAHGVIASEHNWREVNGLEERTTAVDVLKCKYGDTRYSATATVIIGLETEGEVNQGIKSLREQFIAAGQIRNKTVIREINQSNEVFSCSPT